LDVWISWGEENDLDKDVLESFRNARQTVWNKHEANETKTMNIGLKVAKKEDKHHGTTTL
jgi:hypothetical protein